MNKVLIALALGATRAEVDLNMVKMAADAHEGLLSSRILFKLDPSDVSVKAEPDAVASKVADKIGCGTKPARVFRPAGKFEAAHKAFDLHLHYSLDCGGPEDDATAQSIASYSKFEAYVDGEDHDGVGWIEPEYAVSTSWTPDDPSLGSQDHYEAISLFGAWDVTTGSPDVVVQVLDTGVDMAHPDLKMNIWKNPGEICGNGVDDDNNGYVDDCHGYNHADDTGTDLVSGNWHGSHCGGTIAADNNNGVGVAGVAGGTPANSGAKLMISVGFGDTAVAGRGALTYGADMGAQISSNSGLHGARAASVTSFERVWPGKRWSPRDRGDAFEQGSPRVDRDSAARPPEIATDVGPGYIAQNIKDAIDYYNSKKGIVVFAAGNQNSASDYDPAFYSATVAVAAVTDAGVRASFSNYGDWIEMSAPGVSVYSTQLATQTAAYGYASGTSMACPHVAGVLALGLSVAPDLSKEELLGCLYETARNVDGTNGAYAGKLGAGLVDAEAFVACKGFCVTSDGGDQNWGVVKLEGGDFESAAQKAKCLEMCAKVQGVTGCETIWDQWNRGCYAHTRDVARGNGVARHSCWIADDDGAEPAPRPTPKPTAKPVGDDGPTKTVTIDLPDVTDKRSSMQSLTNTWHQWGSETLTFDGAVLSAEIKLNWKDQGWGNKKGAVGVSNGDCAGSSCEALAYYHPARYYTKQTIKLDIYIRDATPPSSSPRAAADAAPTPRPTVEPLHPATDVKVKMHGKVGDLAIASWTHATTASQVKFHVEYLTNEADAEWTRVDDGRSYVDEADGRYYQVVAPPCAHKGKVRVAYVDAAGAASVAYSNTFKMKCK
ncbi:serine-type endopeptidase [Aureococcus anophagefferens]|nr:serine-type endopeptidase [Aureococcus anophagefferens]